MKRTPAPRAKTQALRKPTRTAARPARRERPRKSEDAVVLKRRAADILALLRKEFAGARTALNFQTPFQLLIATILSAQCTDERVNVVTKDLFARHPSAADLAAISQPELETIIHSAGFFRMKAKNIIACSKGILEHFGGQVPRRLEDLIRLAGVGRKTANVVLGQAFGIASGVVVDTHVQRLSGRLGLSAQKTPELIERDLMTIYPERDWIDIGSIFILHGRKTCKARTPLCPTCQLSSLCPSAQIPPGR
jgi:endonuclease-3